MSDSKTIKYFTFSQYHNKKNVGSTKIRVENLIKNWPEAGLYKYGEKPDVMIFQKVYVQPDYELPKTLDCIKILDICDPDWLDGALVKETVDAMDAVVVPTKGLQDFIKQLTDKPVKIIKDRFDLTEFPTTPKTHKGKAKNLVWFGYSQNAQLIKGAIHAIKEMGLHITVISNKDPVVLAWGESVGLKKEQYTFIPYDPATVNTEIAKHDIALLPIGNRPVDKYKSENKDIIANLCGLPVAKTRDDLERLLDPEERNKEAKSKHAIALSEYDCVQSVVEYKELIKEIQNANGGIQA